MSAPTVAVFTTPYAGHVATLRPVVAGLAARANVVVYGGGPFAGAFESTGAAVVDLYGRHPLDAADDESMPVPSRHVTFAAHYAEEVVRELAALEPELIVYDTFAVIARVVASELELPYVNVSTAHNLVPERFIERMRDDPRVATSERCRRAVEVLRDRYGLADASPFAYVTGLSPYLNVCMEPAEWLKEDQRSVFEPAVCYGCLPPAEELPAPGRPARADDSLDVLVSFGTVPWWYWAEEALAALEVLSRAVAAAPGVRCLMTLGGAEVPPARAAALERDGVTVESFIDGFRALGEADVFVTAHGVQSTHEAIYRGVPMLSYPFFADQPEVARFCRQLGIAHPLAAEPRAPLSEEGVLAALEHVRSHRGEMDAALQRAIAWELEALEGREAALDRITALIP